MRKFIIIVVYIITGVIGLILKTIKTLIVKHYKKIIYAIIILSFVIPIWCYVRYDWQIPQLLILYYFLMLPLLLAIALGRLSEAHDDYKYSRGYDDYINGRRCNSYNNPQKPFIYISPEKRRNGGLTDKEVKEKKDNIRKKLEDKKFI